MHYVIILLNKSTINKICNQYCKQKLFSFFVLCGCSYLVALPLRISMSLRERNLRGITLGYAARDHCFVIASEGVRKKRAALFFSYFHSTRTVNFELNI